MTRWIAACCMLAVLVAAVSRAASSPTPAPAADASDGGAADDEPDAAPTPPGAGGPVVHYDGRRLSVSAKGMSVTRVMEAIARETGAQVHGPVPQRDVTIHVPPLPVAKTLTAVLGSESFMLTYTRDGRLQAINVLGTGPGITVPTPAVGEFMGTVTPFPLAGEEHQAEVLRRPISVSGPLVQALGTVSPSAGMVVQTALENEDPKLRGAAREVLFKAFAADPALEAAYLSTLAPVADARLANMLRSMGPAGSAEELLTALSTRAPSQELRRKAGAVLAELRKK